MDGLPDQESPAIVLRGVTKEFKGMSQPALAGITAEACYGRITGLVGPDGAGKTTLIRLMAGLLEPTGGEIRVHGMNPLEETSLLRSQVGYMPQRFGLYEDLSVQENLNLHADLRDVVGEAREAAFTELLKFTTLDGFTDRLAGKLSGGMKQKLGLACALLGKPKVLLLDEPGVGVDPISRKELWRMVHELVGQGIAVLWSTAYLDEAELCEEVILINEGRLLFSGSPRELTARVEKRCWQVRDIEGSKRQLLSRILRRPEVIDGIIQGHSVRFVLRDCERPLPLTSVEPGDAAKLYASKPRFEDAFIDILGGGPGGDSALADRLKPIPRDGAVVVEAVDLTRKFGDFIATDNVTFQVHRAEIFGLLGPNGAGKSTTFKMMCGLLPPTSGSAKVMGLDLQQSSSEARQRLGYMAQKFSLYGVLNVEQNLQFFSGVYGLAGDHQREVLQNMVEIFHLGPFMKTRTDSLSLGYKQRLALACAMMHSPDILFLDEPTSGVDPVTRREFWNHINGVVEKGVTVIVTTHFMDEAEYCDRIGLVSRGKMIAVGTPDELKQMAASTILPEPTMEEAFIGLVSGNES